MDSQHHLIVLQQAAEGSLPARVDSDSVVKVAAVKDLVLGEYLSARDVSSSERAAFVNLSITPKGREHLKRLRKTYPPKSFKEWFAGRFPLPVRMLLSILIALVIWHFSRLILGAGGGRT